MAASNQRPPPPKPRQSDGARPPPQAAAGGPPPPSNTRKASQPGVTTVKQTPKFYDGPTVSAKAGEVANKAKEVADKSAAVAKTQSKRAVAKVRRHPWGFVSLLSTIPFLIAMSLFSTVLCPPPTIPQSNISKLVTSRLNLHGSSPHSSLHQALCYPANVYHRDVLQPYVYPILEDLHLRAQAHPAYINVLEPTYTKARTIGDQAWNGPVKPVVLRVQRGFRRFWFKFVEPHLPYLRAKVQGLTAPYTARISALHRTHLAPHIDTASKQATKAGKQATDTYKYVAAHPYTGHAGKYAGHGVRFAKKRANQAYKFARPHVIRAGNEVERIAREILGPRAIRGLEMAGVQASRTWAVVKANVVQQYHTHLEPHVGPYIAQTNKALAPHFRTLTNKVYTPYILPALKSVLPATFFAPAPQRTFWSMIADILPMAGSNAAAQRGSMNGYAKSAKSQANQAAEKAKAKSSSYSESVSSATASVKTKAASAAAAGSTQSVKNDGTSKKDIEERLKSVKSKIDAQGERSYKNLKEELVNLNTDFAKETLPKMSEAGVGELTRESEYVLKGLDKLFSSSTSLTKDQVTAAGPMAEGRLVNRANKVRERVDKQHDVAMPEKRNALYQKEADKMDALAKVVQRELDSVRETIARVHPDMTKREATTIANLAKASEEWKGKFVTLRDGKAADRAVKSSFAEIDKAVKYTTNDLNEVVEAFRERIRALSKTANERIDALADVRASSSSSATASRGAKSGISILPIVEAAAADGGIGAVIGKGKEQVMDALSQASAAAAGTASIVTAGKGYVEQAKSIVGDAAASASSLVGQASQSTQSVKSSATASASVQSVQNQAHAAYAAVTNSVASGASVASVSAASAASVASGAVYSAADAAASSASSLASAAKDTLRTATRSMSSAVGATPSPAGMMEHLESVANVVAQGAASVYGIAEENVHSATRSVIKAVGATPSPETPIEYAQSVASVVSASASSVYDAAGSAVGGAASVVSSAAVNAPSNVVTGAQAVASSASASAGSLASAASSAVHDATRSAIYAAGATPSPEGVMEHLESASIAASQSINSAASVVSASAASVVGAASAALHDGTRSAIKAVGGTPVPETPMETLESVALAASASAASVYDAGASAAASAGNAVADQAAALGSSIRSILVSATAAAAASPTAEPLLSSASAYLASLTARAAVSPSASSAASGVLASGSSILSSLQSRASVLATQASASASSIADDAASSVHSATRAASRAVGATPTPETAGEVLEDVVDRVKKVLGRDEL